MVQVPVTPRNSVQREAVSSARFRYDTPRNFVGPAIEQAGQAIGKAAEGFDQIEGVYDEADALRITNEYAAYERERLRSGENAYLNARGFAAGEGMAPAVKDIQTGAENLLKGARSDRARAMAKRALAIRMEKTEETIAIHAASQMFEARNEQSKARIGIASTDALDAIGTEDFELHLGVAKMENRQLGQRLGWGPEQQAVEDRTLESGVLKNAADLMLASPDPDVGLVQEFLQTHGDRMLPDDREAVLKSLQAPLQERQSISDFTRAVASVPAALPGAGSSGVPVQDARVAAREVHPGLTITSHRRAAGAAGKAGAGSWHVKSGAAIDAAPIRGMSFPEYVQAYRDAGYSVLEAIDETDPATMKKTGATGPHWHIVLGEKGEKGANTEQPQRWDKDAAYNAIDAIAGKERWTPERIERAKRRADTEIARDEQLKERQEREADREASDVVMNLGERFTSINQIPRSIRDRMSSTDLRQYQNAAEANARPKEPAANGADDLELTMMRYYDPEGFKALNLGRFAGKMTRAEIAAHAAKQAEMRTKPANGWDPSGQISAAVSYGQKFRGAALNERETASVMQIMESEATALHAAGKPIDYNALFLSATRDVTTKTSFLGITTGTGSKPRYELTISNIPTATRRDIVAKFTRERGRAPDEDEIVATFRNTR